MRDDAPTERQVQFPRFTDHSKATSSPRSAGSYRNGWREPDPISVSPIETSPTPKLSCWNGTGPDGNHIAETVREIAGWL